MLRGTETSPGTHQVRLRVDGAHRGCVRVECPWASLWEQAPGRSVGFRRQRPAPGRGLQTPPAESWARGRPLGSCPHLFLGTNAVPGETGEQKLKKLGDKPSEGETGVPGLLNFAENRLAHLQ